MSLIRVTNLLKPGNALKLAARCYSSEIPKNVLAEKELISAHRQTGEPKIHATKPFKIALESEKTYFWCRCGHSHGNPMCDGTHKNVHMKITLRPVKFQVEKSGDFWLCQCKHTKNPPFCDGSHKKPPVTTS